METTFDFTDTPDDLLLPDMLYNLECRELEVKEAQRNKTHCPQCNAPKGKKMLMVTFEVLEPVDYKGAQISENYVIGTDADPCAHKPETLAGRVFGTVYFKQLLKALNVPLNDMYSVKGKRCQRYITTVNIDTEEGKRAINNLHRNVYPVGTIPIGNPTPDNFYKKGGEKPSESQRPTTGASAVSSTVECPRCKEEIPASDIDDHIALCSMK